MESLPPLAEGVPPTSEVGGEGGEFPPTALERAIDADSLNLEGLSPPYLPALRGRAGTFPPFDFVSGEQPLPKVAGGAGTNLGASGRTAKSGSTHEMNSRIRDTTISGWVRWAKCP